jgi:hypothetical protein
MSSRCDLGSIVGLLNDIWIWPGLQLLTIWDGQLHDPDRSNLVSQFWHHTHMEVS